MKKYKSLSFFVVCLITLHFFGITAFANSSWIWISKTRPYDVLPWVVIGTLLIETISLFIFAKLKNKFKTFVFVTLANAISFAAPYLVNLVLYYEQRFPFEKYLDNWPSYTVGIIFCVVTILIELPVVYFSLRKEADSNKKFIITAVVSNIVTTVLVAITERIFCVGRW